MATKHYPKGLDNRMRDKSGEIRAKRSDTKVGTLRKSLLFEGSFFQNPTLSLKHRPPARPSSAPGVFFCGPAHAARPRPLPAV